VRFVKAAFLLERAVISVQNIVIPFLAKPIPLFDKEGQGEIFQSLLLKQISEIPLKSPFFQMGK
jgi:hypothetical protein